MTTEQQICEYLKDLPSKWRDQLTQLLVQIKDDKSSLDCQQVKDCETLTSLSPFTVDGTEVSVKYKDEDSVTVTRTFDVSDLLKSQLELDPNCLTEQEEWDNMTYQQRFQLLVDAHCDCCEPTTTTTSTSTSTSTTTTSSSTTTTTTTP